jgi:hypothetical protein
VRSDRTAVCVQKPVVEQHAFAGQSELVEHGHCVIAATQRPFPQHTGFSLGHDTPLKLRQLGHTWVEPTFGARVHWPVFEQQEKAGQLEKAPQVHAERLATHLPFGQQKGRERGQERPLKPLLQLEQRWAPVEVLTGVCVQNPLLAQQE